MEEDEVLTEDGAEEIHAPNDAVILSYSQMPVNYNAVPKVWLTHPDSTEKAPVLVPFTYGEAMSKTVEPDFSNGDMAIEVPDGELVTELTVKKPEELTPENIPEGMYIAGVGPGEFKGGSEEVEKTVELDFSAGDMEVTPEAGKAFSKVTIPVPANLIPGNIAEGVNIAGIIGSLVAGGCGDGVKVEYGNLPESSAFYTVNHNLGVVPDVVFYFRFSQNVAYIASVQRNIFYAIAANTAFHSKMQEQSGWVSHAQYAICSKSSSSAEVPSVRTGVALDATGDKPISANNSSITFGAKIGNIFYYTYGGVWFAISGLT